MSKRLRWGLMIALVFALTSVAAAVGTAAAGAAGCQMTVYQPYKEDQFHATTHFWMHNCSGVSSTSMWVKLYRNGTEVSPGTVYNGSPGIDRRYTDGCWDGTATYKGWARGTVYYASGGYQVGSTFGVPRDIECTTLFSSLTPLIDDGTPVTIWIGQ